MRPRHRWSIRSFTVEVQVRPRYAIPTTPQHLLYPLLLSTAWPAWLWVWAFITTTFNIRQPTYHLRQHGFRSVCGSSSKMSMACRVLRAAQRFLRRRAALGAGNNNRRHAARRHSTLDLPTNGTATAPLHLCRGVCGSSSNVCSCVPWTTRLAMRRRQILGPGNINRHHAARRHSTHHDTIVVRLAACRQTAVCVARLGLMAGLCYTRRLRCRARRRVCAPCAAPTDTWSMPVSLHMACPRESRCGLTRL